MIKDSSSLTENAKLNRKSDYIFWSLLAIFLIMISLFSIGWGYSLYQENQNLKKINPSDNINQKIKNDLTDCRSEYYGLLSKYWDLKNEK